MNGAAGADDVHRLGIEDAGRHEVERELAVLVDDGMARVVAALEPDHQIGLERQQVDHPALTFIAPLRAHHRLHRHA